MAAGDKHLLHRSIIWKTVLGCLIVATAIVVTLRWKVWFGQPEEEPYRISPTPWRVMLTFGDGTEQGRNVSWQCDSVVREAWVEIIDVSRSYQSSQSTQNSQSTPMRIPAKGEVFQSRAGKAAYYVAQLRNLKPDSHYRYRAVTDGKASPWYEFRTYPENDGKFSFLFVGDVQDTIQGEANRFIRAAFEKHKDAEFLVCGGDLTERPRDINWGETFRSLDSIRTNFPILAITGNHDYLKELPRRLERRFSLVFSYFLDSMQGENQVFTQRYGDAQFFLLDSDRELPYLLEQKEWLEKELAASTAKWKIVIVHHPLYSLRGNNNLIQRWVFADLIEDNKVSLVLQGHEHNYARMLTNHKSTPVYTISHCSPKTYSHKPHERFEKIVTDSRFYQYIKVDGKKLTIEAYDVNTGKRIDRLTVFKKSFGP